MYVETYMILDSVFKMMRKIRIKRAYINTSSLTYHFFQVIITNLHAFFFLPVPLG